MAWFSDFLRILSYHCLVFPFVILFFSIHKYLSSINLANATHMQKASVWKDGLETIAWIASWDVFLFSKYTEKFFNKTAKVYYKEEIIKNYFVYFFKRHSFGQLSRNNHFKAQINSYSISFSCFFNCFCLLYKVESQQVSMFIRIQSSSVRSGEFTWWFFELRLIA